MCLGQHDNVVSLSGVLLQPYVGLSFSFLRLGLRTNNAARREEGVGCLRRKSIVALVSGLAREFDVVIPINRAAAVPIIYRPVMVP